MELWGSFKAKAMALTGSVLFATAAWAAPIDGMLGDYDLVRDRYGLCQPGSALMKDQLGNYSFAGAYFTNVGEGWVESPEVVPGQGNRSRTYFSGNRLIQEVEYHGGLQDYAKTILTFSSSNGTLRLQDYSTALGRTVTVYDCSYRAL